jgi:hypothetical protein
MCTCGTSTFWTRQSITIIPSLKCTVQTVNMWNVAKDFYSGAFRTTEHRDVLRFYDYFAFSVQRSLNIGDASHWLSTMQWADQRKFVRSFGVCLVVNNLRMRHRHVNWAVQRLSDLPHENTLRARTQSWINLAKLGPVTCRARTVQSPCDTSSNSFIGALQD